ncbi:hypothetical protein DFH27DRAFT_579112 [Peziza echinospora]|nr:hypothetical protein DFH27DRAFT_579112 [Peziza echinospora]
MESHSTAITTVPPSVDFNDIKADALDSEILTALLYIHNTNSNPDTIFGLNQYSFSTTQMRINQLPDFNPDIDQGHSRGTYRDFERIPCRWDQVKIALFTTPTHSWVKQNKKDKEGTAKWETAWWHAWVGIIRPFGTTRNGGKELLIWDCDWEDREWEGKGGVGGRIAGQQSFFNHWNGVRNNSGTQGRKLASIHNVWAGGEWGGRGDCLRESLAFMQRVALGEIDLRGDPTLFGLRIVK